MRVTASTLKYTPVFETPPLTPAYAEWMKRVWGAVARPDGSFVAPAYYPFGAKAASDLQLIFKGAGLEFDEAARARLREFAAMDRLWRAAEAQFSANKPVELPLPDGFRFHLEPYNHQRLGLAKALAFWRLFVFWDMGTGKTKLMVDLHRLLRARGEFRRALVACPKVVLETWRREVDRHSRGEMSAYVWDADADPEEAAKHDFVVFTYARARIEDENAAKAKGVSRLAAIDYDSMVLDEGHSIGAHDSGQTRAILRLSAAAARRYDLSGTAADDPLKLYPQFQFLNPSIVKQSYQEYFASYAVPNRNNKHIVAYFRHLDKINAIVDEYATRMKKADCLDLPPVVFQDVRFSLGIRQTARYNEMVEEMKASVAPLLDYAKRYRPRDPTHAGDPVEAPIDIREGTVTINAPLDDATLFNLPHGAARVNKLLQVTSGFMIVGPDSTICDACPSMPGCVAAGVKPYTAGCRVVQVPPPRKVVRDVENPKRELFRDLLENVLESDPTNKVICWGSYLPELDDMVEVCRELKAGHVRVDGASTKDIGAIEDAFQKDPACRVYVGQVASGVGITLTAANYMVYYSLPWNRVHYRQSLDRNNRPGQTRKMTVYRLLGKDTLDEAVASVLAHKDYLAHTMLERIVCAACSQSLLCAAGGVKPFRDGCLYQAQVERPVARPGIV